MAETDRKKSDENGKKSENNLFYAKDHTAGLHMTM